MALGVCFLLAACPVSAQSIDYGASEQIFGEPITTSVTGSPQRASDVPATMEIITADEIRRSGARDIPGVLRHVAGIDVLEWRNDDADVAVRGYNQPYSPRLLVLIDGRQVYADFYGYTPWTSLPIELAQIRQIEVVKGPNSALFGLNAVGGVINIVTDNPFYDRVNAASASIGTQGLAEASAVATLKLHNIGAMRISAGARSDEGFSTPQSPSDAGPLPSSRAELNVLTVARLGRNVVADFEATTSSSSELDLAPSYSTFEDRNHTKSVKVQLSADTRFGLIRATGYTNWIRAQGTQQPAGFYPSLNTQNQVSVAQLEDVFKIGSRNTFRTSMEYRHNTMPTISGGGQISYDVASAGGMWDWDITPALALTNAVRVDNLGLGRKGSVPPGYGLTNQAWNGRRLTEPSFNSGLVWRLDATDALRLTAARGVQMPYLLELGAILIPVPGGFSSGVPTLNPAIVTNVELGWDRALRFPGGRLRFSAYHKTERDIISLSGGNDYPAGLVFTPANIGSSEATGLELSLNGTVGKSGRWGASYTPEFIRDHLEPGFTLATTSVDIAHTTPVHVANANVGWARGPWEADTYLRYESAFFGIEPTNATLSVWSLTRNPSYVSVDARLGYRLKDRLTLSLAGQNIMLSQQRQTAAPDVQRRVTLTMQAR